MNARAVLQLAWRTADRRAQWLWVGTVIAFALAAPGMGLALEFVKHRPIDGFTIALPGYILGMWWAFGGARLLLIHRELRAQRVPAATRAVVLSLLTSLIGLSALAALPLTLLVGHGGILVLFTLMSSTLGLLYALLPAWLAAGIALLPLIASNFGTTLGWPDWGQSGFIAFMAKVTLLAGLLVVLRWRRLLGFDPDSYTRFNRPAVFAMQCIGVRGVRNGPLLQAFERSNRTWWEQPHLPNAADATDTIRIALGGLFAPLTGGSYAKQFLAPLTLGLGVVLLAHMGYRTAALGALLWMIGFACLMLPIMQYKRLRVLYRDKSGGELGELALLPRLGSPSEQRQRLQRAVLWPVWLRILIVGLLAMVLAAAIGPAWPVATAVALMAAGTASVYTAIALYVLSGASTEWDWKNYAGGILAYLAYLAASALLFVTLGVAMFGPASMTPVGMLRVGLAASWSVAFILMAGLTRHYRGRFQRRQHPFLQR